MQLTLKGVRQYGRRRRSSTLLYTKNFSEIKRPCRVYRLGAYLVKELEAVM